MATLRFVATGETFDVTDCRLLQGRTSLFGFFVPASRKVVLGQRYMLEHEGDEYIVVPFEGHRCEPDRTQILAQVIARCRKLAR